MTFTRLQLASLISLVALGLANWLGYGLFLGGRSGLYPLAIWHSRLLSPLVSFLLLLLLWVGPWVAVAILVGFVLSWIARRPRLLRPLRWLLIWPLLCLILLPSMQSLTPGKELAVAPWGQVYHTAYRTLWIDDNYGEVLLYQCDRTGLLCRQIHTIAGFTGAAESLPLTYVPEKDRLILGTSEHAVYVRSQQTPLCARYSFNLYRPGCEIEAAATEP